MNPVAGEASSVHCNQAQASVQLDLLAEVRYQTLPAELLVDPVAQRFRGVRLAMYDEGASWRPPEAAEPAHDLGVVGVRRKALEDGNLSVDGHLLAMDLDALGPAEKGQIAIRSMMTVSLTWDHRRTA